MIINRVNRSRRVFLSSAAQAAGIAALSPRLALAQQVAAPVRIARTNLLIRNAYVMTMDKDLGDIATADVHIRDGVIIAVGKGLAADGARVIDGTETVVLPGLVETHWHMWNSLLRSMAGDEQSVGYFPTSAGLGRFFNPHDMYTGTMLAAAEALYSGITTVHDWCHNPRTPEHADENLRALAASGIRARFSYGPARGIPVSQSLNVDDVRRLQRGWKSYSNGGLLTLGMAWRGVQYAVTGSDGKMAFQPIPREVYRLEYDTARDLGIPLSAHVNIGHKVDVGHVTALNKLGLLYPDLQLIHMISTTPEEVDMVAKAGASVSFSPYTEMRTGFGFPNAKPFLDAGIRVGLSVDTTTLSGNANMFEIMKGMHNIANGLALSEFAVSARRILELGTIDGARSMGMDKEIGSLKPGKRADLIMLNTREINLGMFTEPAQMVVGAAQPQNVSLVVVDGRILKEAGRMTGLDLAQVTAEARSENAALRKRANWKY